VGGGALQGVTIDLYGSGPDEKAMEAAWAAAGAQAVGVRFFPATDHKGPALHGYHVFVNPATSDVLCTATAEALAMGKTVVIAPHPSNRSEARPPPHRLRGTASHDTRRSALVPPSAFVRSPPPA
jgi:hypothetical protein